MKQKEAVKQLLESRSPKAIRKSLNAVFYTYCSSNRNFLPVDFDMLCFDVHTVILFLENLEKGNPLDD